MAKLNYWLNSLVSIFQTKYDEYKETRGEENENKSELFNFNEYISIYYDLQSEKSKLLNQYASNKKMAVDLNRFAKARIYLKDHKLETIADPQGKISELQLSNSKISKTIEAKTEQIEKLNMCLVYADIIKENKTVYDKYKWADNSIFSKIAGASKEEYYNSHKEEIDKYKRAKAIVKNLTGSEKIETTKWEKIKSDLQTEISHLSFYQKDIKKEVDQINHIKYLVGEVNKEFDIDINIEIELAYQKTIARGEKPSTRLAIKEFQKQIAKEDRQKAWAKKHYQKKDHSKYETER